MNTRSLSRPLLRAGLASGLLLGGLLLVGIVFPGIVARHVAPALLYLPGPAPDGPGPAEHGLVEAETVSLVASDGVRLHGWWVPASRSDACGAVLFLHGNAGSIAGRGFLARRLATRGYATLLVDYRGYGHSEGRPDEEGLYRDARAAWRHVVRDRDVAPSRLAVAGNSLGSAVAAHLASRRPVGAVVLTGAFASVPELAQEIYGWLPDGLFSGWPTERFDTGRRVRRIEAPVLVARGATDRLVPLEQTRRVHAAAGPGAAWFEVPGAGHDDVWRDEAFWNRLVPFLDGALGCR